MLLSRFALSIVSPGLIVIGADLATGQEYPSKPITIFTSEPGAALDFGARLIAQQISGSLGQTPIIVNRPSSVLGATVSKAPPDGYNLLLAGGNLWTAPLLRSGESYDVLRDFSPIVKVASTPSVVVVHPSVPVTSIKGLIALAKARPGELNYAAVGIGGTTHIAGELFKSMARVNIVQISYRGNSIALPDILSGQVQLMFPTTTAAVPHVKSGKMRGLAISSAQPSALFPGLPTVAASGLPGYEVVALNGVLAPVKTPAAIINRLNQEIGRVLSKSEVKDKFLSNGQEIVGGTPDEFTTAIKADIARLSKVIKEAGIRVE